MPKSLFLIKILGTNTKIRFYKDSGPQCQNPWFCLIRLLGPNDKFFGHSLWTTIVVKPSVASAAASTASCAAAATSSVSAPPVPPVTSAALQQLLEMGFNLPVEMLQRVLDSVGGNVPAAITALCRHNK